MQIVATGLELLVTLLSGLLVRNPIVRRATPRY